VRIPKGRCRGNRELAIENLDDRVAARAIVQMVQPLLDPLFDSNSFCRPGRGPIHALAIAEHLFQHADRRIWIAEDIRAAFPSVPLQRLLDVVKKRLADRQLIDLIASVVVNRSRKGLRQGNALSPLLMNVYLDHFLDRVWRKRNAEIPLVRFMDDLLVVLRDDDDPDVVYADVAKALRDAGLRPKIGRTNSVHRLDQGAVVPWLGYVITAPKEVLVIQLDLEELLERLRSKLLFAHALPDSPLRALRIIDGLLQHAGPCFRHMDRQAVYWQIASVACECGFEEVPGYEEFGRRWEAANASWCHLRHRAREYHREAESSCAAKETFGGMPENNEAPF